MSRAAPYSPFPERQPDLFVPLLASLLLHVVFVWLFSAGSMEQRSSAPLDIEILKPDEAKRFAAARPAPPVEPLPEEPPAARPRSQIVAPPEGPEAIPENPRFLSDRNSRAEEETVKKGEPAPPAEPPRELARKAAPERAAPAEPARPLPGLESLFASPSEVLRDPRIVNRADDAPSVGQAGEEYAAVPRPDLWADPGERGTPDYLPDVRQGRFTLLNTKADLFAPFVRRVGLRVFQTFSMDFKRRIFAGSVPQGQEKIEVEAIMSPDGRRLEVVLLKRNGNLATDRVLLGSLNDHIFFDENPPPRAVADDGRIHFLFALDAAVWYGRDDRGFPRPGAQWIFGAGLL